MGYLNLFKAVFLRSIAELKRYYLNTISTFVTLTIIFALIAFGMRSFGGPNMGSGLRETAVGYFAWTSLLWLIGDLSWTIMNEMSRGLVEQIFLSPFGPLAVYVFYELVSVILSFPLLYGLMVVVFFMAGVDLRVPPSFFLVLITMMLQAIGIGMVFGGITLKFKRTNALLQVSQFAVIGLFFLKVPKWAWILVPVTPHFDLMRGIMAGKGLDPAEYGLALISTVLYLAIGMSIFGAFSKMVRKTGDLTMY